MVRGDIAPPDRTIGKVAEVLPIRIAALARVRSYTEYARARMRGSHPADIKQALGDRGSHVWGSSRTIYAGQP